jgi:hypothetical protein
MLSAVFGVCRAGRVHRVQHPTQTKIINVLGGPNAHAKDTPTNSTP